MLIKKIVKCVYVAENKRISDGDDANNLIFIFARGGNFRQKKSGELSFATFSPAAWGVSVECFGVVHTPNMKVDSSQLQNFVFPQRATRQHSWLNFVNHDRTKIETNFKSLTHIVQQRESRNLIFSRTWNTWSSARKWWVKTLKSN